MNFRALFGIRAAVEPPDVKADQPMERAAGSKWGQGSWDPNTGGGFRPPWILPGVGSYWSPTVSQSWDDEGRESGLPVPRGPQGSPTPQTSLNVFERLGNGYPGILVGKANDDGELNAGAPSSYRRMHHQNLGYDSVPNHVGGGSSGGNDNNVVEWSLAGQVHGRPAPRVMIQPGGNQMQGDVNSVPSIYARRTVG